MRDGGVGLAVHGGCRPGRPQAGRELRNPSPNFRGQSGITSLTATGIWPAPDKSQTLASKGEGVGVATENVAT